MSLLTLNRQASHKKSDKTVANNQLKPYLCTRKIQYKNLTQNIIN